LSSFSPPFYVVNSVKRLPSSVTFEALITTSRSSGDGQATSARFVERRDEADMLPPVRCVQRTGEVATTLRDLARRYQIVVVDAGGRDSREMRSAMAVANLLLSNQGQSSRPGNLPEGQ
jgi:hypothetical protein